MADLENLWGDDFQAPTKKEKEEKIKKIKEKIESAKSTTSQSDSIQKTVKSKKISLEDKLNIIKQEVLRVLQKQKDNVIVIKTFDDFMNYLSNCKQAGRIAVDTETNNSLEPLTCQLMGLCLYSKGQKQAYIPVNHRDPTSQERLPWQLTEEQIYKGLNYINKDPNLKIIMHNGKFDYQVLKCTCSGIQMRIDWDTMIGAKLLDENELRAGLKEQYIDKIDPEQEKYHIDELFTDVYYADVDPEIFALYAATDSYMTDRLYEWQMNKFKDPDLSKVLNLADIVEMPLVHVLAELELAGMDIDQEYAGRLSKKYNSKLVETDHKIEQELKKLDDKIQAWKMTPEANARPKNIGSREKKVELNGIQYTFHPKKKEKRNETAAWWEVGNTGNSAPSELISKLDSMITTEGKSPAEQLTDPINLSSPTQLAILFYDILKAPVVNTKQPRGTGEDELAELSKKLNMPICDMLIERRGLVKLLSTYIDNIPQRAAQYPDGRIRTSFHQYGAATGRLSSGDNRRNLPNFQNVPSHAKDIRMMFKAKDTITEVIPKDNELLIPKYAKVNTPEGMRFISELSCGDSLRLTDENSVEDILIKDINLVGTDYCVSYQLNISRGIVSPDEN